MYYEEKVINGVLCCRYIPSGEWIKLSKRELTRRLEAAEIDSVNLELVDALNACWGSLKTYGEHPIIDMWVKNAIKKATGR